RGPAVALLGAGGEPARARRRRATRVPGGGAERRAGREEGGGVTALAYRIHDADQHYDEPDDCFTRHIETALRARTVRVERSGPGPGRMWVGDERCHFFSVGAGDSGGPARS